MKIEKTTQDVEVKTVVKQNVINLTLTEGEYYFLKWVVNGHYLNENSGTTGDGLRYKNLRDALKTQDSTTMNGYKASEMFKVEK